MATTLKPGIYKLDHDITNPAPDRRKSRDWRYFPVIKAGTEFVVNLDAPDAGLAPRPRIDRHGGYPFMDVMSAGQFDQLFQSISASLVPLERSLDSILAAHHLDSPRNDTGFIVQLLLDAGKITLDDVQEVLTAYAKADQD